MMLQAIVDKISERHPIMPDIIGVQITEREVGNSIASILPLKGCKIIEGIVTITLPRETKQYT
jgi:hypothetical protein